MVIVWIVLVPLARPRAVQRFGRGLLPWGEGTVANGNCQRGLVGRCCDALAKCNITAHPCKPYFNQLLPTKPIPQTPLIPLNRIRAARPKKGSTTIHPRISTGLDDH